MKAMNLHGLLLAGALVLIVSCREENRRDDRYDNDRRDRDRYETGDRVDGYNRDGRDRDRDFDRDRDGDRTRNVSYTSSLARETEMITGDDGNKVWKVRQDLNDSGIDEAYSSDHEFHFYRNNTFTLSNDGAGQRTGMWAYDGSKLTLKYTGDATLYSYTVSDISNNRIELVAGNGADLVLVDKDFR